VDRKRTILNSVRFISAAAVVAAGMVYSDAVLAQTDAPAQKPAPQAFGPRLKAPAKQQQRARRRGPPPEIVATFDDWKIQCETVRVRKQQEGSAAGAAEGETAATEEAAATDKADGAGQEVETRRLCGMVQSTRSDTRPQIGLTLYISRIKQGEKMQTQMRVMAPIGVFLPTGVGLEIDGVAVSRVPFSNCLPQICLARAEASPETLDKLKKGSVANFIIWEGPGSGMPMKISLKGFGKALEALDQL
jgi:invasion protein IalB